MELAKQFSIDHASCLESPPRHVSTVKPSCLKVIQIQTTVAIRSEVQTFWTCMAS